MCLQILTSFCGYRLGLVIYIEGPVMGSLCIFHVLGLIIFLAKVNEACMLNQWGKLLPTCIADVCF